jgi:hypothetical protein
LALAASGLTLAHAKHDFEHGHKGMAFAGVVHGVMQGAVGVAGIAASVANSMEPVAGVMGVVGTALPLMAAVKDVAQGLHDLKNKEYNQAKEHFCAGGIKVLGSVGAMMITAGAVHLGAVGLGAAAVAVGVSVAASHIVDSICEKIEHKNHAKHQAGHAQAEGHSLVKAEHAKTEAAAAAPSQPVDFRARMEAKMKRAAEGAEGVVAGAGARFKSSLQGAAEVAAKTAESVNPLAARRMKMAAQEPVQELSRPAALKA